MNQGGALRGRPAQQHAAAVQTVEGIKELGRSQAGGCRARVACGRHTHSQGQLTSAPSLLEATAVRLRTPAVSTSLNLRRGVVGHTIDRKTGGRRECQSLRTPAVSTSLSLQKGAQPAAIYG